MPGMDGDEALAEIRKTPGLEFLPVIAVTASSLADEENARKERFSGYVRKPFSKRELFEELADFLPRHAQPESPGENRGGRPDAPAPPTGAPAPKELDFPIAPAAGGTVAGHPRQRGGQRKQGICARLEGLGQRWQCEPLVRYAQKLLRDAENYAVTDLEKHLGEFSALVEQLDRASMSAATA